MVFVHGAGGNRLLWGSVLAALPPSLACIAADLPGHGRSAGPGKSSVAAYAQVCACLLDELNLGPVVLAGHSLGGGVAMSVALTRPDLVRALVLVASGARLRVAPAILEGLATDFEGSAGAFALFACGQDAPKHLIDRCLRALRSAGAAALAGDLVACDSFDIRKELAGIRAPTLVVCGENDALTPLRYSQYLASNIVGAALVVVPASGHMVMLQAPGAVATAIAGFLGSLPPAVGPDDARDQSRVGPR